jgi:predicted nuclease of predicted toxin-antitoxin system
MKLLVDNQLPVALARYLSAEGWDCIHVRDVGLDAADDRIIWKYAAEHHLVIVSKDEDFQILANQQGGIPPQVVWVRIGNCRKNHLLEAFSRISPLMRTMLAEGRSVIEVR